MSDQPQPTVTAAPAADVFCCYLPPGASSAADICPSEGDIFEIQLGPEPTSFTHACRSHLGELVDSTDRWQSSTVRLARPASRTGA